MKILVTGGAGFIGSHIADAYVKAGHDVTILDNLSTGRQKNLNPDARFVEMDLRDKELTDFMLREKFELVNHQAAQMDVRLSVADPMFDADNNSIGLLNLLQRCADTGVKKVIFASSGGVVYGEQDYFPADEEHPTRPVSPYGVAKLVGEKYLYYYNVTFGLDYTAFRYANVFGPRQNPHGEAGVIAIFLERMLNGQKAVINGDGKQTRDFVYIDDVVRANVLALDAGANSIYNIGTGVETDVNEIFRELNRLTGANLPEEHAPAKAGEQLRSVLSVEKAKQELGWQPTVEFSPGLEKTVEYFKQQER